MIANIALVVSRSGLKAIQTLGNLTGLTPDQVGPDEQQLQQYAQDVQSILDEIKNSIGALSEFQNQPGNTDPGKTLHGLAPDETQSASPVAQQGGQA
jgi:hypothetical protein